MQVVFWSCVALIVFAYVGYPMSMFLIKKIKGKHFHIDSTTTPSVAIIIAAADEQDNIIKKLENTIALDYPKDKLEVIVSLDGSTDKTAEKIRYFNIDHTPNNTITVLENEKGGKESAQKAAVEYTDQDICIFTDVGTMLGPNTIKLMVRHFGDARVGAIDGMSKIDSDESNEGVYLKYENKIREWEAATSGLVTMGGCLFAVRTNLVQDSVLAGKKQIAGFASNRSSDLRTALIVKTNGLQTILDTQAVALYADGEHEKEFGRKHRTIVRGITNVLENTFLLNPFKYGLFSYALFSHKLVKWAVPFFMIGAFISNIFLIPGSVFWSIMFICQLGFYAATVDLRINKLRANKIGKLISFFVMSNLSILKAWWSYIKGERFISWEPTKRVN